MIGPGTNMDVTSEQRSLQNEGGKIDVGKMTVKVEKKVAAPNSPEDVAQQQALEMQKAADELNKKLVTEATTALQQGSGEARNVLRLISGNEAIVSNLLGLQDAEYLEASMIKEPKAQQQKYAEIQKKYAKLIQYAENRQNETRLNISRLKQSENPKDQALAMDLENTNAKLDLHNYEMAIIRNRQILDAGINPRTGQPLEKELRSRYSTELAQLVSKKIILEEKTKNSKGEREKMRDVDGKPIRNVIDDVATALSGEKQDNSISFLETRVTQALTSEASMNKFADELVTINVLNETDKAKFIDDMKLGLTVDDIKEAVKKGGKKIIGLMGVMSVILAYAAYKKSQEGQGQSMMG